MSMHDLPQSAPGQPPSQPDLDALVAERQAAAFLGVTIRALQKWRVSGSGPRFIRISSRCIRYRRRDLLAWIEARLKSSTAE